MKIDNEGASRICGLVASCGLLGMAPAAFAQQTGAVQQKDVASETDETAKKQRVVEQITEVVVTGSRISTAGFDAPTPTTVVGEADLRQAGRTDLAQSLGDVPQFRMSQSAASTNTVVGSGISPADLRGLGSARTLVLINNRRTVGSGDLQTIPYSLVKRIDVVTGGASAAYGSGAVAGVVNIILNDELEGLEVGAQTGFSTHGDGQKYLFHGSFGTPFADGRGHLIAGTDYLKDEGLFAKERPRVAFSGFFAGADGKLYPTADIREANRTAGGLITTGVLAGQTFNDDGTLRPFQFGMPRTGTAMIGGDSDSFSTNDRRSVLAPIQRANVFVRPSFAVTDNLTLWAEGTYNRLWDERVYWPDFVINQLTFSRDNPFLSDTIRNQLIAANETGFTMGRALTDVALARYAYSRETFQGSIGLDGRLGDGTWRYNAFFTHGKQTSDQTLKNITLRANFANAIDAVRAPDGSIVCRVALTDPGTACRPLDLFGSGRSDQAAIDYATANWNSIVRTWLDHAGASISGEPFQLWTRPVSVAAGVEYRKEAYENDFDPNALAARFNLINGVTFPKTGNTVKEAFAEANIPLLADRPIVQALNFNGAVRVSDYSTSGAIWSWKLGLVWDVMDGLKFRGTRSRDIRAASLTELFSQRNTLYGTVNDLGRPGNPSTFTVLRSGGNPNLQPELADTLTFGAVLAPSFMPGFDFSIDYYDIKIANAITALTAQQIVNACYLQNNQAACGQIVRDGGGEITEINASNINVASLRNKGVDFEATYRTGLESIGLPGQLRVRALATYVDSLVVDNGVVAIEGVGYLGGQANSLVPRWRGLLSATYESTAMGADIRARYVGGGGYAPASVLANQGADLHVGSITYVDLGLRGYFDIGDKTRLSVYGDVQNLFDRGPVLAAFSPYHDIVGRYFTVGVRANF